MAFAETDTAVVSKITSALETAEAQFDIHIIYCAERSSRIFGTSHDFSDHDIKVLLIFETICSYFNDSPVVSVVSNAKSSENDNRCYFVTGG